MNNGKKYQLPDPIINEKEYNSIELLTKRYEKMTKPGKLAQIGQKIGDKIPDKIKDQGKMLADNIALQEVYQKAMELIGSGFNTVQEQAAKYTINEDSIIKNINKKSKSEDIESIDEICLLRSYEVSSAVNLSKTKEVISALAEGAITGAPGFAGLPFNLVLSTLLYFRAVQEIAMYYGFDVKSDSAEMIIAGEVFTNALNPVQDNVNNEISAVVSKVMVMTQASLVKQTAKKTWTDMASRGGIPLLIAQMRALANKAAQKALENAGAKGLENSVFKDVFEQIGRKLTLNAVDRAVPVVSAVIGALIDTAQMNRVIQYADIFYQKRFLLEKETRINYLIDYDAEIIDADYFQVMDETED